MSLRINQNIEALTANRYLAQNDEMLSKSIERLASGQKINSATDGPSSPRTTTSRWPRPGTLFPSGLS